ncbi:iron-containing alcohol dehydrogenase [Candidatus Calescamantes bacterium]|nr:iron-containing alcohol dehydrogenase [Candidatus Calescamantes bacterium]
MKWRKFLSSEYLGKNFPCSCGRKHAFPINFIYVGDEGVKILERFIREEFSLFTIVLVCDLNTLKFAETIGGFLRRKKIFLFEDFKPLPTIENAKRLLDVFDQNTLPVAVGSGTITDLVRFASFQKKIPFISYPTAPSMNGYTSSISALLVNGLKTTLPASPPFAIISDLSVISSAPLIMLKAGLGDLLSRFVSAGDWVISGELRDEYFCPFLLQMMEGFEEAIQEIVKDFSQKKPEKIKLLMELLLVSGLVMTASGSSRPVSGAEHLISHYWDMTLPPENWSLHGLQVSVGTWVISFLWEKFFSLKKNEISPTLEKEEEWREIVREHFKNLGKKVEEEYLKKWRSLREQEEEIKRIKENLEKLKIKTRKETKTPPELEDFYSSASLPQRAEELGREREELKNAMLFARYIRNRYTILDLLHSLGLLENYIFELFKGGKV